MIIGIEGDSLGCGKTITATALCYQAFYQSNYQIISNIWFSFPFIPLTDPSKQLRELNGKPTVLFIDEISEYADSRASLSLENKFVNIVARESRKRKTSIIYTQQISNMADTRLRSLTNVIIECFNLNNDYIELTFVKGRLHWYKYLYAPFFYNKYNTDEIVGHVLTKENLLRDRNENYSKNALALLDQHKSEIRNRKQALFILFSNGYERTGFNNLIVAKKFPRIVNQQPPALKKFQEAQNDSL